MKDWFKARNIWGAAISALSDAEAGRLAKAIWAYTMNGEIVEIEGAGKGIFAMILLTLGQDEERDSEISEKRSLAGKSKGNQMISSDNKCNQLISSDDNKNKNKNKKESKNKEQDINRRFTPPSLSEVTVYCQERNNGINPQSFIDFYASKGWKIGSSPMKDWKACVRTWEQRDSRPEHKKVTAQSYTQRDYTGEQDEAMKRMLELGVS